MPSTDDVQYYVERVENYVYASATAVANEVPHIGDSVKRLWADVTRYGPKLPDIKLPGLGEFEIPPPPPPPPPPRSVWDRSTGWVADHPWTAAGIGAGALGATLLVGYNGFLAHNGRRTGKGKHSGERKQVVVVLGGDTPLALTLIHELEQKGYIVIASASTSEAASEIEHKSHGYVRALVLDPLLPDSVPNFLRLLVSALSRRFPIDAGGDPHASPASMPYIHSVISLLGLSSPALPPPGPLEHLQLVDDYMPYLTTTHIVPLMVIQALLPLLRSSSHLNGKGRKKSIVFCVPAADARVGLPFSAASAMSAAATARGAEVLRREIAMAAATGNAPAMKDINVVVMDIGAVESPTPTRRRMLGHDAHNDLDAWTDSEQLAYGPAYKAMTEPSSAAGSVVRRRPSPPKVFADKIVGVVSYGRKRFVNVFGYHIPISFMSHPFMLGSRYAVGAGAFSYTLASNLPHALLDVILNLPYLLVSVRNALLPVPPLVTIPREPLPEPTRAAPAPAAQTDSAPASDHAESDVGSDADVESNLSSGENSGVESSWISLGGSTTNNPWKGERV
ncbi:hypothetical protein PENSPDRAFT_652731 [Peniophora sp. CONT]|nr:hypothetical protein PENSPDRAFT_652731 [Peniophora sp. CONT]